MNKLNISEKQIELFGKKPVIYRIFNINDGKSYIGKCENGIKRILDHYHSCKRPKAQYRARLLYRAIAKHGLDNFRWEILFESFDVEFLDKAERELIASYKTVDREFGYNITAGGTGGNVWLTLTPEEAASAKFKLSEAGKRDFLNNPERRQKAAETLRAIRKDKNKSAKNAKIASDRLKLLNKTDPRFRNRGVKVRCIETGVIYNSMIEAARILGLQKHSKIRTAIDKKTKVNGYSFELVKELV
jgi:group I intron endonuclease